MKVIRAVGIARQVPEGAVRPDECREVSGSALDLLADRRRAARAARRCSPATGPAGAPPTKARFADGRLAAGSVYWRLIGASA